MNFFAESTFEYIKDRVDRFRNTGSTESRLLIMVCSLPAAVTLELGDRLTSYQINDGNIELVFKISKKLAEEWKNSPEHKYMGSRNWIDNLGNLTSYRNSAAVGTDKLGLVVLVGTDKVTDASGLADFHQCNIQTIWQEKLKKSFATWIENRLSEAHVAYEEGTIDHFDMVLDALRTNGRGDALQIASLLAELPLEKQGVQSGKQAERLLLRSLGKVGMPSFSGFSFSRQKSLNSYIENAGRFFSYDLFLEERTKEKALEAIHLMQKEKSEEISDNRLFVQDERGIYQTDGEFLNDLRNYVSKGDRALGAKLKSCDFINIWDRILKFRIKKGGERKVSVRKLTGGPVEVILTALWQTMRDFKQEVGSTHPELSKIIISSERFKHDYECEFEDHKPTAVETAQEAMAHLRKLVGGVDKLFSTRSDDNPFDGYLDLSPAYNGFTVPVECHLMHDDITCSYARTAEPALEFRIDLSSSELKDAFTRKFAWRLPETQSYRLVEELIAWAYDGIISLPDTWILPVYHVSYYEELIRARDDDETRRVLLHCTRDDDETVVNMLSQQWLQANDPLLPYLKKLAEAYGKYLKSAKSSGIHSAFLSENPGKKSPWDELRQAYENATKAFVNDNPKCKKSPMAAMLMRAFLILSRRSMNQGDAWTTAKFERSGVATVLHPAVLEMLDGHIKYLFACFNHAVVQEIAKKPSESFKLERWQSYLDLAAIQMPITGLISDENLVLDTSVHGQELIHRIGSSGKVDAPLSTRLLLRYEGFDEEDFSDAEMFYETRESRLLARLMIDYLEMHPHARDGISLAVYRNEDIQPVIAAVHEFLNKLASPREPEHHILKEGRRKPYAIGVTIFTESVDSVGITRWIEQWRERWEASETEDKFLPYRYCRFSVAHRLVTQKDGYSHFKRMIADSLEVDIAILYDFIGAGRSGNDFENVEPYDVTERTLRFPILEKAFCSMSDPHHILQRSRIISNRQFRLGTLHAEVMARLKNKGTALGDEHVVLGYGDYTPWQSIVDELHKRTEWVVCIDPNIDERLIKRNGTTSELAREIVGFGSGVGLHGESNYTISTEKFSLSDISYRLELAIKNLYPEWPADIRTPIAQSVLREAQMLSGLSLVRATGVGTHIHDFMAYSLTRKILKADTDYLCDHLVSLDAFRHWFDSAESGERPDLLWMVARIGETGCFEFDIKLIECKLAKQNQAHIDKAIKQLENGLATLIPAFMPRMSESAAKDDDRPDQRYWWLQLHRLVASKTVITQAEQTRVLAALERLADGDYSITWGAAVFAFWTDSQSKDIISMQTKEYLERDASLSIGTYAMGNEFVRDLCIGSSKPGIPWSDHVASFGAVNIIQKPKVSPDNVEVEKEKSVEIHAKNGGQEDTPKKPAPKDVPAILEVSKIPDRILLGVVESGNRKIYWEFGHKDLNNRHMLVFGTSGMGKTYAIQCLLCELGRAGQNSLVLDYTNGFLPIQLESETNKFLNPTQHIVRQEPLPISPFKMQTQMIAEGLEIDETAVTAAKRIASTFKKLYGTIGDQQYPILMDAVMEGIIQYGDKLTLEQFQDVLQSFLNDDEHEKSRVQATLNKLKPFILEKPFSSDAAGIGWGDLFSDKNNKCHIFQFAGMDSNSSQLVIEFVLWDLNAFVRGIGNKNLPKVVVLDEAQNLDLTENAPVAKYLTEGRKFGLSLILATQTMENLKGDKLSRLFQAGHKLFFRPSENEFQEHAKLIQSSVGGTVQEWVEKLASLKKGECYSLGYSLNNATSALEQIAFKIRVTSLGERNFHG